MTYMKTKFEKAQEKQYNAVLAKLLRELPPTMVTNQIVAALKDRNDWKPVNVKEISKVVLAMDWEMTKA